MADAAQMACQTIQSCEQARIGRYPAEIYSCGSLENISPAVLLHQPAPPRPSRAKPQGLHPTLRWKPSGRTEGAFWILINLHVDKVHPS